MSPIRTHQLDLPEWKAAWSLEGPTCAYRLAIDADDRVIHVDWGDRHVDLDPSLGLSSPRPWRDERFERTEEYPPCGRMQRHRPAIDVELVDGDRSLDLRYVRAVTFGRDDGAHELTLVLQDTKRHVDVHLHYACFANSDVIERRVTLASEGDGDVIVRDLASASVALPDYGTFEMHHLEGAWGSEAMRVVTPVTANLSIGSRAGVTGFDANPAVLFCPVENPHEAMRPCFGLALAYSGNWVVRADRDPAGRTRIASGASWDGQSRRLTCGERIASPVTFLAYSGGGAEGCSDVLRQHLTHHVLRRRPDVAPRPVLYNSWYVHEFDVNEDNQRDAAAIAAELGVDVFVIDDGWFVGRMDDTAGLGDWHVDGKKFPSGLEAFEAHLSSLGMRLGLWVEPEMVNRDSDLHRARPDWVLRSPGREPIEHRNQLVLNLARPEVRDFLIGRLDAMVDRYDLAYLKWDFNRPLTDVDDPAASSDVRRDMAMRQADGADAVFAALADRHPDLWIESCASGGGRVDAGVLRWADQFWMSDNTDATDIVDMHAGYSIAYPASTRVAWVADPSPLTGRSLPLSYRFHAAMLGVLGIGADVTKWSRHERDEARRLVSTYHRHRATIQAGRQLTPRTMRPSTLRSFAYLGRDGRRAVIFAFMGHERYDPRRMRLLVPGLPPHVNYRIEPLGVTRSGGSLALRGVELPTLRPDTSLMLELQATVTSDPSEVPE